MLAQDQDTTPDVEEQLSELRRSCFASADLRHAGLAEVDWEGADLRGADLRDSTFQTSLADCGFPVNVRSQYSSRYGTSLRSAISATLRSIGERALKRRVSIKKFR